MSNTQTIEARHQAAAPAACYILEKNGPIIAQRMRDAVLMHKTWGGFNAVACQYGGTSRVYAHRTMRAAFRSLSSICSSRRGKLWRKDDFAAAVVTPDGHVMNWGEVRAALAGEGAR